MPTTIERLTSALDALDDAAACCVAVGLLPQETAGDVRRDAADAAVTSYEAADAVVEALLEHIIAAGGCPGLLDALGEAQGRAARRQASIYQLKLSEGLTRPAARAWALADHAWARALEREQRVIAAVALPFWRRRVATEREA